jgi:hypothetical protein
MNIISEFLSEGMYPDEITVEPHTTTDEFGNRQYGTAFTVKARITGRTKLVLDQDGQERVSSVQASIAGAYNLKATDRYTLPLRYSVNPADPSDLGARQPQALGVDRLPDEHGAHHEIVQFSNARVRTF